MTTKQNHTRGLEGNEYAIAQLIITGLAGQRSPHGDIATWSGREYEAVRRAAEELAPLYRNNQLPDELIARLGRAATDY
jgi:hypothetical protein